MIDWINFAVFLNAWNLNCPELSHLDGDRCGRGTWHIVDYLLKKCISDKTRSTESLICSSRADLTILVQLVTEPLAWHGLVIQSCLRSSLPAGKKKKKGGLSDHSTTVHNAIRDSIQSLCAVVEEVLKWLREQIDKPENENIEIILSSIRKKGQDEGPGRIFQILESSISSINETELGDQISHALKSWSLVDVARKMVTGGSTVLSEFRHICELKIKSLQAMKQQIAQV